jgi:hypothetical protein
MKLFCTEKHPAASIEIDWHAPTVDPRVRLVEALWKDEEWQAMTKRISARLFPNADQTGVRTEILRVLGTCVSEPKATAPAEEA